MSRWKGFCLPGVRSWRSHSGFTIIEFMVALALLAIAVGMAVPFLQRFTATNQLVAASNAIVTGLNLARGTAITTGEDITICPSKDGVNCGEDNWDAGWIVFNDRDSDGAADSDEIVRVVALEGDVDQSGFGDTIVFRPNGTTRLGSDATITSCSMAASDSGVCTDVRIKRFGSIGSERRPSEPPLGGS